MNVDMCNRYEQKGSVSQIRALAQRMGRQLRTTSQTDNLPPHESVYPDQDAPVIINTEDGGLELTMMRWGFPPIPEEKTPITNIRNLKSKWWKDVNKEYITSKAYRCLVPFTAFAEPARDSTWFAVPDIEIATFAGFWCPFKGERLMGQPGQKRRVRQSADWRLFAFLTTEANDIVRPIHEKAMPVILFEPAEQTEWLNGEEVSLRLQKPLLNEQLRIRA